MTAPLETRRNRYFTIERRCERRRFLLRPDAETNNAFIYCMALACQRTGVKVVLPAMQINHHHTVCFDPEGRKSEFTQYFHLLLAKTQNARRGRNENFWNSQGVSYVEILDEETIVKQIVYAATNPVKDNLVEKVHHWPGVNGLPNLLNGRPLKARRPRHFFCQEDTELPEEVELPCFLPPELGTAEDAKATIRKRVAEVEVRMARRRARTGRRVLGRRELRRQSWKDVPRSRKRWGKLSPRFAGGKKVRIAAITRRRNFLSDYKTSRRRWNEGDPIPFPVGTYWLRRFMSVPVVGCPDIFGPRAPSRSRRRSRKRDGDAPPEP